MITRPRCPLRRCTVLRSEEFHRRRAWRMFGLGLSLGWAALELLILLTKK